jgi:hypothetical protein
MHFHLNNALKTWSFEKRLHFSDWHFKSLTFRLCKPSILTLSSEIRTRQGISACSITCLLSKQLAHCPFWACSGTGSVLQVCPVGQGCRLRFSTEERRIPSPATSSDILTQRVRTGPSRFSGCVRGASTIRHFRNVSSRVKGGSDQELHTTEMEFVCFIQVYPYLKSQKNC